MRLRKLWNRPLPCSHVRVWDVPTRLLHWAVVLLFTCSWYSADVGLMRVHSWSGSLLLTLLLFRVTWGFLGSTTARFSDFLHLPPKVIAYLKALMSDNRPHYAGHNPAGGFMVMVLIATLLAQVTTGLFSNDGIRFQGPLALWVSSGTSDRLTELHGILFNFILLLVWTHLVAVFFYLFVKQENLIRPMVTGYKHRDHVPPGLNLKFAHWAIALAVLAVASGIVGSILFS